MSETLVAEAARFVTAGQAGEALGITRQRVGKLVERWPEVKNAAGRIDVERLRQLRAENADPLRQMAWQHGDRARAAAGADVAPVARKVDKAKPPSENEDDELVDLERANFSQAKTHKARSDARLQELKVLELEGLLINRREVESLNFAVARRITDRLRGLPAKLQQFVMPDAMPMLEAEIDALLKQLSEDSAKAVDEAET